MYVLAALLGGTLLALAGVHVYWAVNGADASVAVPIRADGSPLFHPSAAASLTVAFALVVAAGFVFGQGHLVALPVPDSWIRLAASGIALAFAARAIGDFRYVGLGRRVRGTRFARWDAWLYTPLCLLLSAGIAVLAAS